MKTALLAMLLLAQSGLASFTVTNVSPRKIVTPNGDGVNDTLVIVFENPADAVVSVAKVYDLAGAEVGDFKSGAAVNTLEWDGRDGQGRRVRGGVYVYRIQADRKTFTGTVVVAR